MRRWFFVFLLLAVSASIALADGINPDDPYLNETGSACGSPTHVPWCAGTSTTTVDPQTGMKTLMYQLVSSQFPTGVAQGTVLVFERVGSTVVDDVINFENLGTTSTPEWAIFVYSSDISGGLAADVGLPPSSTYFSNQKSIAESTLGIAPYNGTYIPASGEPGYGTGYAAYGYQLASADIPEPSSLLLLGSGLLGLAGMLRKLAM